MRLLFLTHSFNSLAQRLFVDLRADGHEVTVELDVHEASTMAAVARWRPEVVIAPFMKRAIPEALWAHVPCLVVHPGIRGDRGPSSLDWAILEGEARWGVTVLQANAEMDAGDIWATCEFPLPFAPKSAIYRREVADAASTAVRLALARMQGGNWVPESQAGGLPGAKGRTRPTMPQEARRIDWACDSHETVLRKLYASDSNPGVRDAIADRAYYLFGAHPEGELRGKPGTLLAQRDGAICRATREGAVWITHLQPVEKPSLKLPAAMVLRDLDLPEVPASSASVETYREIRYEERGAVGYLSFDFYNGAMSTDQCRRLQAALAEAASRPIRVLVLRGGRDFWSNGIHLHVIEAADSAADASWENIQAIDDLTRDLIETTHLLTIAAMGGNSAAGGVFFALAADYVLARDGCLLNPHYKSMGNLYGSEYWTYLLPRRVGAERAQRITDLRLPIGVSQAQDLGLVDRVLPGLAEAYEAALVEEAERLAAHPDYEAMCAAKQARRREDEASRPLESYRAAELARMRRNFYGFDPSYHVARYNFVYRIPHSRTPSFLAEPGPVEAGR